MGKLITSINANISSASYGSAAIRLIALGTAWVLGIAVLTEPTEDTSSPVVRSLLCIFTGLVKLNQIRLKALWRGRLLLPALLFRSNAREECAAWQAAGWKGLYIYLVQRVVARA